MKNGKSVGVRKPRGVVIVIDVYSETRDEKIRSDLRSGQKAEDMHSPRDPKCRYLR